jgi:hypothetical protein
MTTRYGCFLSSEEVCIGPAGPDAEGFFGFRARQVLPRLREG